MPTFPFTPGYSHETVEQYTVTVNRFDDQSEQRYLTSRQRGQTIHYEFTHVDCSYAVQIQSWFLGNVGPRDTFSVLDHRTQSLHTARFAGNAVDLTRRAPQDYSLTLDFVTVQAGGTDPLGQAYTRTAPPPCFVNSFNASTTTPTLPPDPTVFVPPSGTIVGCGNSMAFDAGADLHYWYMGSVSQIPGGWIWPSRATGPSQIDGDHYGFSGVSPLFGLYATPFICARSGAILERVGVFGDRAATAAMGVYAARSASTQVYPGSRIAVGSISVATSLTTATFSGNVQLIEGVLYFFSLQLLDTAAQFITINGDQGRVWIGVESNVPHGLGWSMNSTSILPATFPDSAFPERNHPGFLVRLR